MNSKGHKLANLYRLRRLDPDRRVAHPAWRLEKIGSLESELPVVDSYDVHTDGHGTHCTCRDFLHRRENTGQGCKHIRALEAVGVL